MELPYAKILAFSMETKYHVSIRHIIVIIYVEFAMTNLSNYTIVNYNPTVILTRN